jgi:hypothetical protein
MRREYSEAISLSTASLDAHFWGLNAYVHGVSVQLGGKRHFELVDACTPDG